MTDEPSERTNQNELARQNRLAKALRENLKRRKSQARGRADAPADLPEDPAADTAPHLPTRQIDPDHP